MGMPLHKLSARFEQHPANMMVYLVDPQYGASFEDVWPVVKDEWVEAMKWMDGEEGAYDLHSRAQSAPGEEVGLSEDSDAVVVSEGAALVVEKLWRARRWGAMASSPEALQKHTHLSLAEIQEAMRELAPLGVIVAGSPTGPYALSPARRSLVEAIARRSIAGREGA